MPKSKKSETIIQENENELSTQSTAAAETGETVPPAASQEAPKPKRASRKKKAETDQANDIKNAAAKKASEVAENTLAQMVAPQRPFDSTPLKRNSNVLTIEAYADVQTQKDVDDAVWHEIQNAYITKRILTGNLGGMQDLYKLCEEEYQAFDRQRKYLYTEETLREVCLGIHSMCVGSESKYFNGYSNITDDAFLVFGVKGIMDTNKKLKDVMLFNILSYMSNQLLGVGNTAASIDELYMYLTNMTAIEYIRNAMKRVRKKESSIILASQNIEDFLIPEIREFTKPLFSIPTHQFLFNAGQINPREYMDALQVEAAEFELIKYPERGTCLFRCGNERYLLQVIAPEYKSALFGKAGGR